MPIYKSKSGKGYRVEVNYTDSFGNRKKVVRQNKDTLTLRDAKQLEAEILRKISVDTGMPGETSLDELYEFYAETKKNEIKLSTIESNDRRYKRYIKPYFGTKKITKITKLDLQNWKNEIVKLKLSNKYMNHIYTLFSGLFNFAIKYDYLEANPLSKIGRFKEVDYKVKKINFWTKEEFDKFILTARNKCEELEQKKIDNALVYWGYYVMFNIMFYCGCRKGEVYPLQWKDVDIPNKILHITKGLIYKVKGAENNYILSTPKTKSSIRDIVMPDQLIKVLDEHKERYKNVYLFDDDFYICGGVAPIRDTVLENFKNECIKESGVKKIRIHDFRHSHASLLINNGVNISVISKRLGHSSIKETLDTYSHMYQKSEDEAVNLINSLK